MPDATKCGAACCTLRSLPLLLASPRQFFAQICPYRHLLRAAAFVAIVGLLHGLGLLLRGYGFRSVLAMPVYGLAIAVVAGLGGHVAAKAVGGRGGFQDGFAAAAFASLPSALGFIPWIGTLFNVWSIYLFLVGLWVCYGVERASVGLHGVYKGLAAFWTIGMAGSLLYAWAAGPACALPEGWVPMRLMVWFLGFASLAVLALISCPDCAGRKSA
jgi:hypothetical protein